MLPDDIKRRNSSLNLSSALDGDLMIPPHRPLVGGGSAAAYEAARADHYNNMAQKRNEENQRRSSGFGSLGGGLSVNPNQHYEMLKLHHMNLLNEIQETTLMMNLYQQQQLQQQQQQLQQQSDSGGVSDQMAMFMGGQTGRMGSIGLGPSSAVESGDLQSLLRQQQKFLSIGEGEEDESALQFRLQALKDDIARHQKEAEVFTAKGKPAKEGRKPRAAAQKRKKEPVGDGTDGPTKKKRAKKAKEDEDDDADNKHEEGKNDDDDDDDDDRNED
jgi:hypothetical protein